MGRPTAFTRSRVIASLATAKNAVHSRNDSHCERSLRSNLSVVHVISSRSCERSEADLCEAIPIMSLVGGRLAPAKLAIPDEAIPHNAERLRADRCSSSQLVMTQIL